MTRPAPGDDRPVSALPAARDVRTVEVLWRPGCPYCTRLRRGLRRAGVVAVERDIWADPAAAARVRAATGGDETVPTVVIGDRALVNPSVRQVVEAIRARSGPDAAAPAGRPGARGTGLLQRWRPRR